MNKKDVCKLNAGTFIELSFKDSPNEVGLLLEKPKAVAGDMSLCVFYPKSGTVNFLANHTQVVRAMGELKVPMLKPVAKVPAKPAVKPAATYSKVPADVKKPILKVGSTGSLASIYKDIAKSFDKAKAAAKTTKTKAVVAPVAKAIAKVAPKAKSVKKK